MDQPFYVRVAGRPPVAGESMRQEQLCDGVVVDYDDRGEVLGIDFYGAAERTAMPADDLALVVRFLGSVDELVAAADEHPSLKMRVVLCAPDANGQFHNVSLDELRRS